MSGRWNDSDRRSRLPAWWAAAARQTLREQPYCRCDGCKRCGPLRGNPRPCGRESVEVDHIIAGDDHSPANRRGICKPCHADKSSREGNAARRGRTTKVVRHPGRLT